MHMEAWKASVKGRETFLLDMEDVLFYYNSNNY